jgi:GAF domain-containing protein
LSARLIKAQMVELDGEIERSLTLVREFFQADRCALLGIRDDRKFVWVSHVSYGEGISHVAGDINPAELFPWSYEKLVVQGTGFNIASMEKKLPEDAEVERRPRAAFGIKSVLSVPLFIEGRVSFLIVLNAVIPRFLLKIAT